MDHGYRQDSFHPGSEALFLTSFDIGWSRSTSEVPRRHTSQFSRGREVCPTLPETSGERVGRQGSSLITPIASRVETGRERNRR